MSTTLLGGLAASVANRGARTARHWIARLRWGGDLPALAAYFGTDKWGQHFYARHYQTHFAPLRHRPLRLLEIGIGGENAPGEGGASLRMWKAYFPRARILGLDLYDKRAHDEDRITTVMGSQADAAFLEKLSDSAGPFDIVIDDGSHVNGHVLQSFRALFPRLSANGLYVIEDLQTSYWSAFGGAHPGDTAAPTSMNLLKSLVDGLNHREYPAAAYEPSYLDRHVVAVHFYHNLAFVQKGVNDEPSNVILRPEPPRRTDTT